MRASRRAGMSVVETVIVIALLSVIALKATLVLTSANESHNDTTAQMTLEDQARTVLDQMAYAIIGADRTSLYPEPLNPIPSSRLQYRVSLGIEDGEPVFDDLEEIGLSADESQVLWRQRPDDADEIRVAWCNVVRPFLEGELFNGDDDNDNDIIDEKGLAFVVDRDAVTIRLSLEREGPGGEPISKTVETTVTVRN